jgi:hypothetical protein
MIKELLSKLNVKMYVNCLEKFLSYYKIFQNVLFLALLSYFTISIEVCVSYHISHNCIYKRRSLHMHLQLYKLNNVNIYKDICIYADICTSMYVHLLCAYKYIDMEILLLTPKKIVNNSTFCCSCTIK